jgi:hypothetical protein
MLTKEELLQVVGGKAQTCAELQQEASQNAGNPDYDWDEWCRLFSALCK